MSLIIPKPAIENETEDFFYIEYDTEIILDSSCNSDDFDTALRLKKAFLDYTDFDLLVNKSPSPLDVKVKKIILKREKLKFSSKFEDQAYRLVVKKEKVEISSQSSTGLFYGASSFIELLMTEGACIKCRQIEDSPLLEYRGFYHDATRGRVRKLSEYKKLADTMALFKMNQLQLYVEHSFCFRDFSEVWRDDTPITSEEILELDKYCQKLHIDLVPSIASFGHLYKVLRTISYKDLCELDGMSNDPFSFDQRMQHHTLNVSDDRSFDFVKKMLDEFIPLFSSKYVNICADETFDLGKGKSSALAEKIGINQMYVDFVNKLADYCVGIGKIPMFWGDIIVSCPDYADKLNPELICLNWGYSDCEQEKNTQVLAKKNMKQFICPGCHGWRHMINKLAMAYKNISLMSGYALKYNAMGVLNTDWGDYGHMQDPLFSIPAMIYGADFGWSGVKEEKEIDARIGRLYYGDRTGKIIENIKKISECEAVRWEEFVQYKEHSAAYDMLEDAKCEFEKINTNSIDETSSDIEKYLEILLMQSNEVNIEGKRLIRKIALYAKGQILIQQVIKTIGEKIYRISYKTSSIDGTYLAAQLEHWMYAYKSNWRKDSKESELYRIEQVFYWYSDLLRNRCGQDIFPEKTAY